MTHPADRLLFRSIRLSGRYVPLLAVASLGGALAELALPAALGRTLDAVLQHGDPGPGLAVVAALVAAIAVTDVVSAVAAGFGAARATSMHRSGLLRHVLALPPATAARHAVGDLVTRLVVQAAAAGRADAAVVLGLTSLIPAAGSLVMLTLLDPLLGGTFVLGVALLTVLLRSFVTDASAATAGYQHHQGRLAGHFVEALGGAKTVAAAGTADREIDRVLRPLPALHANGLRIWTALSTAAGRSALLALQTQLAVLAVAGLLLVAGRLTPGELLAAAQYAAMGTGLGAVVATLNRLIRVRAGCRGLAEILAEPVTRYGTSALAPGPGELRLRDVVIRAPDGAGPDLLAGVDLTVPGGQALALVGSSGAGKSTLAAVAARLRDPDAGEVTLDGVPLARLSRAELAAAVGTGFERPVLVGDTVGDAIGLGRPDPSPEFVEWAAGIAVIDGWVGRLPQGYATPLWRAPMSGGEAQRLGLARALHGRRLLVLDDAASSLDSVTEAQVRRSLHQELDGRTRLIVTHRAATAATADLVAWLDGGRLRALAPHRELWRDPEYRAVFPANAAAAPADEACHAGAAERR